jgi:uncharacterized protein
VSEEEEGYGDASAADDSYFRFPEGDWKGPVPVANPETAAYWSGLAAGLILILRCDDCRHWVHYPLAMCPCCHSFNLRPVPVSGEATVYSYTVVHRTFAPGVDPPYAVGLVELKEQAGLRLVTNLVNCRESDLHIGLRVRPLFKKVEDEIGLVFFEPDHTMRPDR